MTAASCSPDELQRRAQVVSPSDAVAEQLTSIETRTPGRVYAESIPKEIKEEVETWQDVGNSATQPLVSVLAGARVALGYGLVGLARIAVALAQDPSEGWRIRERERAARMTRGEGSRGPLRNVAGIREGVEEGAARSLMFLEGGERRGGRAGGPTGGTVVRRRGGARGGGQRRDANGSADNRGGRRGGHRRGTTVGRGGRPKGPTVPIRRGQRPRPF